MTVEEIVSEELAELQSDIISRHERAGQIASGKTKDMFTVETNPSGGILFGAGYVGVLERGRKPGKVPYDMNEILLRWAAAKGIIFNTPTDAKRWAYFVTQKIRKEGTELYRSGRTEDIFDTAISEFTDRLVEQISTFFQAEIENKIFKI